MGREARVAYRAGRERAEVRAHLDSAALQLGGGKTLNVPFADIRKATVAGGALKIETKTDTFELDLGAKEAALWAKKILNPPTLADKLGLKPDSKVLIAGERIKEIDEAAPYADHGLTLTAAKAKAANVVILTLAPGTAEKQIAAAAKALPKGVALWFVYTKGTKPNGDGIIALARKAGLKDTKVARISETHAALRFIAG
jgi:hypothetical protein